MKSTPALVVGGGISGLTVAYDLHRSGVEVLLVEEMERLGGLVSTVERDGFLMDLGPDAFLAAKPHARALCEELGIASDLIATNPKHRRVYVLHRGRLHPLPEGMRLMVPTQAFSLLGSRLFSMGGKLRMLLEPLVPARKNGGEESVASFVSRRFGAEALERVGEPLLAGIHCGEAEKLSMDFLFPGLVELERRRGSVLLGMRETLRSADPGAESPFLSLASGMGELTGALARWLAEGATRLGAKVTAVRRDSSGFLASLDSGEEIAAKALVLAVPLRASERLLAPLLPEAAALLARIPTVSTAVVFHAFRRQDVEHPLDGYGFVVPRTEPCRLLAATFVSTKLAGRAPDSHVLIRTFLGGRRDPAALEASDEDLVELSLRELERVVGPLGPPLFSRVQRWPDRTPQAQIGHRELVAGFERELAPGLWVLGSGLRAIGIPDSIAEARTVASQVAVYLREPS